MSRIRHLPLALLLLAVALVYANSLHNGFHFDDFHAIVENPAVRSLGNLPRIATDATMFSVLPANRTWRPVVTASLAVDYALGRSYDPLWFHVSTLLWFGVLLVLLDRLWELLLDRTAPTAANRWLALGAAAWFGLHPAMAETVNYIIQRGDLYCTLGCVAGLYVFARWQSQRSYGLYLLPFALAMLSKPPAIVFPLLLALYVWLFESKPGLSMQQRATTVLRSMWPAFSVAAALLALTAAMTPRTYAPGSVPGWSYRLTQPYVWLRYAGALFLPLHLNVDTDLVAFPAINARSVAGMFFTAGVIAAIVLCARRRRLAPIAFGLGWFLLTQLPTSIYALSEVENDHRMFFSFPGLMLAVVWALHLAWRRALRHAGASAHRSLGRAATVLALAVLSAYAYGAHRRNDVWRDEHTLWADDIVKSPHNGRGWMMYGLTLLNSGAPSPALVYFERGLRFTPNYPDLELNLAIAAGALADEGDASMNGVAEARFQRALRRAPLDDRAHAFYARWLLDHGQVDRAAAQAETAVALNPSRELGAYVLREATLEHGVEARALDDARALTLAERSRDARINASLEAYRRGDFGRAAAQARGALSFDPSSALAWNNLGAAQAALGQFDQASVSARRAIALDPTLTIARNNLALFQAHRAALTPAVPAHRTVDALLEQSLALYTEGRLVDCIATAREALALDARSAIAWNNIAAAEASQHHWDAAIAAAERAATLDPAMQLARNNLAWALDQRAASMH